MFTFVESPTIKLKMLENVIIDIQKEIITMRNSKIDRRVQMSKTFLKQALISLLKEKRISRISVKELCELADVNRSTFYAHYTDIYSLLNEMENDIMTELTRALQSYVDNAEDPIILTEKLIEFIGLKHEECEVLLSTHSNLSFEKKIKHVARQFMLFDSKNMIQTDERLFDYISSFIISGSIEVVKTWLKNDRDKTPREIAELITELTSGSMMY